MKIQNQYLLEIKAGRKKREYRLFDQRRRRIQVGDLLTVYSPNEGITVMVEGIEAHKSWKEAMAKYWVEDFSNLYPSLDECVNACQSFYAPDEVEEYGIVVFSISKPLDPMEIALLEAKEALKEGEVPVGAVVTKAGAVYGCGHNSREKDLDVSGHAEINAIRMAEGNLGSWALDGCEIHVTLEPCLMCSGAILQSRIKTVVCALEDEKEGAVKSKWHVFDTYNDRIIHVDKTHSQEAKDLLSSFFKTLRSND